MVRAALLVAALALMAHAQTEEDCKRRVAAFTFNDNVFTASQAKEACRAENWLTWFYLADRPMYNEWVAKEQMGLGVDEVLAHAKLRACLKAFMYTEFSAENLIFLDELGLFRTIASRDVRAQKACELWTTFVAETAKTQVNIGAPTRVAIGTSLSQCPAPGAYRDAIKADVFDAAETDIISLIRSDTFRRFIKSKQFQECVHKGVVDKEIRNYAAIQGLFCQEEENAYATRSPEKKAQVQKLVRAYWDRKCKTDPRIR
jgi:hypothetical protein